MTPDVTWGFEASLGATWFFLGGFGLAAEMVGDIFYGEGTREKATTTYPVLSGQLGLVIAYEVLIGRLPFVGEGVTLLHAHAYDVPTPPLTLATLIRDFGTVLLMTTGFSTR